MSGQPKCVVCMTKNSQHIIKKYLLVCIHVTLNKHMPHLPRNDSVINTNEIILGLIPEVCYYLSLQIHSGFI